MSNFLSFLINGISQGSIYALIALGYTMVYGIAKMLNFAHGDVIMIGGFATWMVMSDMKLPVWVAIIASVVVCVLLGVTIEKVAYKPLRNAAPLAVLITAIGVSYLLQNSAQLAFGSAGKPFTSVVPAGFNISIGDVKITGEAIVTILVSVVIMIAISLFIKYTKSGKAMLAVSEDRGAAQLMGINVNRTITLTFAIGSALAAIAGILLCSTYFTVKHTTGAMPGIRAFTAAVFGGIGSIPGAMIGGIVIGIVENLSIGYISGQFSDAIVFGVLIVILLVKPTGLLGKKINEKV